jgi:hypothetical protein
MRIIFFIILLIVIFLLFYNTDNFYKDNFVVCPNTPTGPYSSNCSLINFNSNILTAYCPNNNNEKKLVFSRLDMDDCNGSDNCSNVRTDNDGSLIC